MKMVPPYPSSAVIPVLATALFLGKVELVTKVPAEKVPVNSAPPMAALFPTKREFATYSEEKLLIAPLSLCLIRKHLILQAKNLWQN